MIRSTEGQKARRTEGSGDGNYKNSTTITVVTGKKRSNDGGDYATPRKKSAFSNLNPSPEPVYMKFMVPHPTAGAEIGNQNVTVTAIQKQFGVPLRSSKTHDLYLDTVDDDSFDEQPVDMSVKRFKRGKSSEVNKRRPSVIAFASHGIPKTTTALTKRRRTELTRSPVSSSASEQSPNGNGNSNGTTIVAPRKCSRTRVIIGEAQSSGEMESIIDEHFRRSLGAEKYKDLFKKENTPSETETEDEVVPDDTKKAEVEQASVDDHFAKALGSDYWLKLNKSIPKSSKTSEKSRDGGSTTPESQEENIPK